MVPVSVLYVWVYLVVEMGIYVFVGRAAICISEVSGLRWKVEGIDGECYVLVFSDADGCVGGFCREKSLEYAGSVVVCELS